MVLRPRPICVHDKVHGLCLALSPCVRRSWITELRGDNLPLPLSQQAPDSQEVLRQQQHQQLQPPPADLQPQADPQQSTHSESSVTPVTPATPTASELLPTPTQQPGQQAGKAAAGANGDEDSILVHFFAV